MIESVELVIKQPGQADRIVRLHEGATRIGRAEDNEVVLSDVGVSRRHAQVYVSRGEVTVEDLGSGNGTYYNGYRVQSQPVQDSDEIVIDPFVLQFRIRGQQRAPSADASASSAGARLEVVVGTGMAGSSYPITSRGLSVGRSEDRDVVIPDPAASRHHCQLSQQGSEYVMRDMGSANGIFVNGVRVRECTLADNDIIRIGNTEMRFVRTDQATMAAPPPPVPSAAAPPPRAMSRDWADQPVGLPTARPSSQVGRRPAEGSPGGFNIGRVAALLFAGGTVFMMFMVVVLVGSYLAYAALYGGSDNTFEPHPPRWRLDLPPNLQAAPVPTLFKEGRDKMKDRDHKGALQDFYRVLNVDPGRPGVGKFAYAAGEALVLETLREDFKRRENAKARSDELRKKYLARAKSRSASTRRKALRYLKQKFADDPVVIEELDWQPPEEVVKRQQKSRDAMEKIKLGSLDEAAVMLEDLLAEAVQPALREEVLAGWLQAQEALAAQTQERWGEAVLLEARGEKGAAKREFKVLAREHAQLPSARAHLERY